MLGRLDDKIELNREMNATLEEMARALFRDWFVDFGPTRGKQAGQPPYLAPDLWSLFPDHLDDNGIPDGWTNEALADHVIAEKGLSYKGAGLSTQGTGLPLHNLNSVLEGGGYKNGGLKFYTGDYKQRHMVSSGDLIVANTEQRFDHLLIGFSALIPQWAGEFGLFSHHLFKISPRRESYLAREWLHFAISTSPRGETMRRFSNGTTVNMLPSDSFELPRALIPPEALVQAFDQIIQPILRKQEQATQEAHALAQTRDLLLPRLMSGELRIEEARKQMEAAG